MDDEEDDEDMGTKAKALTNLLKTSSVRLQYYTEGPSCTNIDICVGLRCNHGR